MIFMYTWEKVLSNEKTLTSRIVKPGDVELVRPEPGDRIMHKRDGLYIGYPANETRAVTGIQRNGREMYTVGKTYAVQPARTAKAIGRIQLLAIRQYDVRDITAEEARREGFASRRDFWVVWQEMHDNDLLPKGYGALVREEILHDWLAHRPAERYQAWQLSFKLAE